MFYCCVYKLIFYLEFVVLILFFALIDCEELYNRCL